MLNHGILSKAAAELKGFSNGSHGLGENSSKQVSLSTSDVFRSVQYSGEDFSFIVDPRGLYSRGPGPGDTNWPPCERQISFEVPVSHIVGITIPDVYFKTPLESLIVLRGVPTTPKFKFDLDMLNRFYQKTLGLNLMADEGVAVIWSKITETKWGEMSYHDRGVLGRSLQVELNRALMLALIPAYEVALGKSPISALDITRHHVGDRLPFYTQRGEPIGPEFCVEAMFPSRVGGAMTSPVVAPVRGSPSPLFEEKASVPQAAAHHRTATSLKDVLTSAERVELRALGVRI